VGCPVCCRISWTICRVSLVRPEWYMVSHSSSVPPHVRRLTRWTPKPRVRASCEKLAMYPASALPSRPCTMTICARGAFGWCSNATMVFRESTQCSLRTAGNRSTSILRGQKFPAMVSRCALGNIGWNLGTNLQCIGAADPGKRARTDCGVDNLQRFALPTQVF
jgi:hypothetical protein